nr:M20/M25/M40 family metallo-hydrolase [Renibacterium salmoninarum]
MVRLLITADEELGSGSSRELIEYAAAECAAVLVFEASSDGGALKTGRKGTSIYQLVIEGRAAHAGLEPEKGVNATVEIAHQILAISALADPALGTTVTPTRMISGETSNTVPARAELSIDVRARSVAELKRVDRAMRALQGSLPGSLLQLHGGINRPPLEAKASAALYQLSCQVAIELGIAPTGYAEVGGASDGNFTAGLGIPTLDGLGAVGGGAHAQNEHVDLSAMPERTALAAGLIQRLLEGQLHHFDESEVPQ